MPLELLPTLDNLNTQEIEAHLIGVRNRRLLMQIEYQRARGVKLSKDLNKIEARLEREINMFQKELTKLIEIEEKCKNRLSIVQILMTERSFTEDMMETA